MKADLILLCLPVILLSIFIFIMFSPKLISLPSRNQIDTASKFYDPVLFRQGLDYTSKTNTYYPHRPSIIILPHHLLASYIIADLLTAASRYYYDQIFLIGPNHFEAGNQKIISGKSQQENQIIEADHSIGNPMLYIDYYFPKTPVKKFLLKQQVSVQDIQLWTEELISESTDVSLFIFSIDFSHYLPANIAASKDTETINYIRRRNISDILKLSSDHVDSPGALALSLTLADRLSTTNPVLYHHTNSGYLLSNFSSGTTSYLGMVYLSSQTQ